MNIRIESNFNFSVSSIQYAPNGELQITRASDAYKMQICQNAHLLSSKTQ